MGKCKDRIVGKGRIARWSAALALGAMTFAPSLAAEEAYDPEKVYRDRLEIYLTDYSKFVYEPMEEMPGDPRWQPFEHRAAPSIDPAALEDTRAYAEAMNSSAFIVWRDGKIETEWYGEGTDVRSELVSKSLSKPLAAIAVGRAIAMGKIASLDEPIARLIPELDGTQKGRILIRHLLDMRSGMQHQSVSTDPASPLNTAFLSTEHGKAIIEDYPMIAEPGTIYSYANAPADLIAELIERATGRRYGEFVSSEVFKPLGALGGEVWLDRPDGLAHSGCCMTLPAETFLRLAVLLLDDGVWEGSRLLPEGYVAQMSRGTEQNPHFGLGIWIGEPYAQRRGFGAPGQLGPMVLHSEPYLDPDLYLFDGNSNQIVQISPANRLIVLRMGATPPRPGPDNPAEWDNSYLVNTLIRGLQPLGEE